MRHSKPTLRNSFFGWLGGAEPTAAPDTPERTQQRIAVLRARMFRELGQGSVAGTSALMHRILCAQDGLALWYCRSELMQALSRWRGESDAAATVAALTPLFKGLVPDGMLPTGSGMRRR